MSLEYLMCPACCTIADRAYWNCDDELRCPVCDCADIPNHMRIVTDERGMFKGVEEE